MEESKLKDPMVMEEVKALADMVEEGEAMVNKAAAMAEVVATAAAEVEAAMAVVVAMAAVEATEVVAAAMAAVEEEDMEVEEDTDPFD